jgi:hypothetical protein
MSFAKRAGQSKITSDYDDVSIYGCPGAHVVWIDATRGGESSQKTSRPFFGWSGKVVKSSDPNIKPGLGVGSGMVMRDGAGAADYFFSDVRKFVAAAKGVRPEELDLDLLDKCCEDASTLEGSLVLVKVFSKEKRDKKSGEVRTFTEVRYESADDDTDPCTVVLPLSPAAPAAPSAAGEMPF